MKLIPLMDYLQARAKGTHARFDTAADRTANFPAVLARVRNGMLVARRHARLRMRHGIKPRKPSALNVILYVSVLDRVSLKIRRIDQYNC
jgi:hypothetical protein